MKFLEKLRGNFSAAVNQQEFTQVARWSQGPVHAESPPTAVARAVPPSVIVPQAVTIIQVDLNRWIVQKLHPPPLRSLG